MPEITNHGLTHPVGHRMLYSCTIWQQWASKGLAGTKWTVTYFARP